MSDLNNADSNLKMSDGPAEPVWSRIWLFLITHQRIAGIIAASVVGFIVLILAYHWFVFVPRERDAADQMFRAQNYFEVDSLNRAIKGDGTNPGFEAIVSEYDGTTSANLALYYLGSAYLRKGEYNKAIRSLSSYKGKDNLTGSEALGMIGDAYCQLNDFAKAQSYYERAASNNPNSFTSALYLWKQGLVFEHTHKYSQAAAVYERIKTEFSTSAQARDIDKYIGRVNQHL